MFSYLYHCRDFHRTWLYTYEQHDRCFIISRECLPFNSRWPEFTPGFLVGSVLLIFLVFCVVLLYVFTFWVPCCDVRYDFRIKAMFGSSLPSGVCRRAHVLFTLYVFVCVRCCSTHIVFCFCLVYLRLAYPLSQFSLDFPFFIAPSVFCNVYLDASYCMLMQM